MIGFHYCFLVCCAASLFGPANAACGKQRTMCFCACKRLVLRLNLLPSWEQCDLVHRHTLTNNPKNNRNNRKKVGVSRTFRTVFVMFLCVAAENLTITLGIGRSEHLQRYVIKSCHMSSNIILYWFISHINENSQHPVGFSGRSSTWLNQVTCQEGTQAAFQTISMFHRKFPQEEWSHVVRCKTSEKICVVHHHRDHCIGEVNGVHSPFDSLSKT